jgi:hypothetical protein
VGGSTWTVTLEASKPAWNPTAVECISAGGAIMPLDIIVPTSGFLARISEKLVDNTLTEGGRTAVSDSDYSNRGLGLRWLFHFNQHTHSKTTGTHRLLLLDVHGSHLTRKFIEVANAHNIVLLCLPPHSTHALQPLEDICLHSKTNRLRKDLQSHCR